VKSEHFHITLVFLGERNESVVHGITDSVGPALEGCESFGVVFGGFGIFGSIRRPKLFYEKIGTGKDELQVLHSRLQNVLEPLVGRENRPYLPHLTLGRPGRRGVRGPEGGELLPSGVKPDNVGIFLVEEVKLYQSILHPNGAEYILQRSWPLKEAL